MSRQLSKAKIVYKSIESTRQPTLVSAKSTQKPLINSFFQTSQQKFGYKFGSTSASKQTSSFDNKGKRDYHKEAHARQLRRSSHETVRVIPDEKDEEITRHLKTPTYLNINEGLVNGFNGSKSQMSKNLKSVKSMSISEQGCRNQLMQCHLSAIEAMELNVDPEFMKQAMNQLFQQNIVQPPNEIEVWVKTTGESKDASSTMGGETNFYDFTVNDSDGAPVKMEKYRGKVVIVVNTASQCGFTNSNYSQLKEMLDKYKGQGLEVAAFPCNQFGKQEPGCDVDIKEFVKEKFKFDPDLYSKIDVNGKNAHPLFEFLKKEQGGTFFDAIKWNFTKFLIDRQGKVIGRYAPTTEPKSMVKDVEKALSGES